MTCLTMLLSACAGTKAVPESPVPAGQVAPMAADLAAELDALASRGILAPRPVVSGGTIRTAAGQLLRGGHIQLDLHANPSSVAPGVFRNMRDAGANLVRLTRDGNGQGSLRPALADGVSFALLDRAVLEAGRQGLIAKVEYARHSPGSRPDRADITAFWSEASRRYGRYSHVVFGLANEPVAWEPGDYLPGDITLQQDLYRLVRSRAPDTLIMLMGFSSVDRDVISCMEAMDAAGSIDWTKACVDFHGYGPLAERNRWWQSLKDRWPAFCGEFTLAPESGQDLPAPLVAQALETLGISWCSLCFDGLTVLETVTAGKDKE